MKLNDLVKKYILSNKKNSLLIIISIIISTALFLVMNIIAEDSRNLMIDQSKKDMGENHASYYDPTNKEIEYIQNNPSIDKVGLSLLLGMHDMGHSQTLQLISNDENSRKLKTSYTIQEGTMPKKNDEIAIDKLYIDSKNIKNPIGKVIKIDYKRYNENGDILYTGEKSFKVTAILKSHSVLKAQGMSLAYITEESAKKNIPLKNKYDQVTFKFKQEKNIEKQVNKLVKDGNLKKENMRLNNQLIIALSDSISMKIPYIIVNIILALATVLLIYNIFYILVLSRIKDFAILRALGFIPTDIFKMMFLEVFIYSAISISLGILLGNAIANLTREYIIGTIYSVNYTNTIRSDNYVTEYVITALISITTVLIAVIKPLISSTKIEPMVAIRRNEEKIVIKKTTFVNKFMRKMFKDSGNIASKNLQRNIVRTNLAIASMTIVIILMLTIYTKSTSNFLQDGGLRLWVQGDYLMHDIDIKTVQSNEISYDKKLLQKIKNIDGVKKVNSSRNKSFYIEVDDKNINKNSSIWKKTGEIIKEQAKMKVLWNVKDNSEIYDISFNAIGIEDLEILKPTILDGEENLEKLNELPYIYVDEKANKSLNIKKGNKVKIGFDIIDSKTGDYKETIHKDFIIAGIIKHPPITGQASLGSFEAVMSVNQLNKFVGNATYERFDIWTSKFASKNKVESELDEIINKSGKGTLIKYKDESSKIEKNDNQKIMIMVIVVGIVIILSLFNCCNTIVTSINSRIKEFALYRAIGISKDEIEKIIKLEGLVYIIISSVIAILPSLIIRAIIIDNFENIDLINLNFLLAMVITLLSLLLIITITSIKSLRYSLIDSFIEQLKTLE